MKITRKQVYIIAFLVFAVVLIVWGFLPSPISVSIDRAGFAPLEVTIEEEGITQVIDRYTISAPVTGYILRLQYKVGDTVEAGQKLVDIQPVPDLISARQRDVAEAQLEAARARLKQAQESLELAQEEKKMADVDLQRVQNLYDSGVGSEQVLDNAKLSARRASAQLASAKFSVNVAQYEIKAAQSALKTFQASGEQDNIPIRTPVDGQLLKIHQKSEGTVQAGTPVLEIGDPFSLEIRVDLLTTDAVQLSKGTPVRIKRWGRDSVLEGVVRRVEPSGYTRISALGVEEQRVPVIIDIVSPREEWQMLGDGFRVVAEFIIWQGEKVLQVPSSSLFRTGEEWALFQVDEGEAALQKVEVGHQSGLNTEIIKGLKEGQKVITHPDERIEDGTRVKARN